MAKAAQSEDLAAAFEKHFGETAGGAAGAGICRHRTQGKNCPAILGLLEEGAEIMDVYKGSPALDAGLMGPPSRSNTTKSRAMAR